MDVWYIWATVEARGPVGIPQNLSDGSHRGSLMPTNEGGWMGGAMLLYNDHLYCKAAPCQQVEVHRTEIEKDVNFWLVLVNM